MEQRRAHALMLPMAVPHTHRDRLYGRVDLSDSFGHPYCVAVHHFVRGGNSLHSIYTPYL